MNTYTLFYDKHETENNTYFFKIKDAEYITDHVLHLFKNNS